MANTMRVLKLCPHCGGKADLMELNDMSPGHMIKCQKCPARMWFGSWAEFVVSAWNARTPDPIKILIKMKLASWMCGDPGNTIEDIRKVLDESINEFLGVDDEVQRPK